MQGHGSHWAALYDPDQYVKEKLPRDLRESKLICRAPCMDVVNGTERAEQVFCLRYGSDHFVNQMLVVSNTRDKANQLFSGYPVLLDGITHSVVIEKIVPWEYAIEGWIHARVTKEEVPLAFFDTMFLSGSARLEPEAHIDVSLAGLAYVLSPIRMRSFEVKEGPMWEMERQRRRDKGETAAEAERPMVIHMTGAAIFLPREGEVPDDVQFQGMIEAMDIIEHDGQKIYRLEMVVLRAGEDDFRLPVFVAEHVLDGYVPRVGEDVEGVMWLQGRVIGSAGEQNMGDK